MGKQSLITVILIAVAFVACLLIARGVRSGRPPGQRGLKGTGLENSRMIFISQIVALIVLVLVCVIAIAVIWLKT